MDSEGHPLVARRVHRNNELRQIEPVHLSAWDGSPPELGTAVHLGHDGVHLLALFRCDYDGLDTDPALPTDRSVDGLWEHDVVELFLADTASGVPYREVEASPLGQWLDYSFGAPRQRLLSVTPKPTIQTEVRADAFEVLLVVPLGRPVPTSDDAPGHRLGIYRVAGPGASGAKRRHFAHLPTLTPEPDFHRPERWALLRFADR